MSKVNVDELNEAIKEIGEFYLKDVTDAMNEAAEKTAEELKADIRRDAPRGHRKKYHRYGRVKMASGLLGSKKFIWHVAKPEYRLAHLLERPHRKARGGGMTTARPHIKKNEEKANNRFYERCIQICKRGGK